MRCTPCLFVRGSRGVFTLCCARFCVLLRLPALSALLVRCACLPAICGCAGALRGELRPSSSAQSTRVSTSRLCWCRAGAMDGCMMNDSLVAASRLYFHGSSFVLGSVFCPLLIHPGAGCGSARCAAYSSSLCSRSFSLVFDSCGRAAARRCPPPIVSWLRLLRPARAYDAYSSWGTPLYICSLCLRSVGGAHLLGHQQCGHVVCDAGLAVAGLSHFASLLHVPA